MTLKIYMQYSFESNGTNKEIICLLTVHTSKQPVSSMTHMRIKCNSLRSMIRIIVVKALCGHRDDDMVSHLLCVFSSFYRFRFCTRYVQLYVLVSLFLLYISTVKRLIVASTAIHTFGLQVCRLMKSTETCCK